MKRELSRILPSLGVMSMLLAAPAHAQSAADEAEAGEIVVTGTLVRGARPVGSNVISAGQEEVQAQGAATANELLATIPQVSNLFNTLPVSRLNVAPNQIQVVRPNLRNLTEETGSSSSTLVLFDGHRVAGVGVTQSAVDPDLIPTGAIERVEVVTDGGSATYGADAVGGVINFITRRRFDGVQADARYGFADNYETTDINLTVGEDWGSGSLFGSYMHQENDALFGRDRDWIRQINWNTGVPTSRQCSPGNVSVPGPLIFSIPAAGIFIFGPGADYGLPNLATPGVNNCDDSDHTTFVPEAERDSALVGFHQEINNDLTLDVRAFYGRRETQSYEPLRGQASVTPAQAFYIPLAPNPMGTQTVYFDFSPLLGVDSAPSGTEFEEWGLNAELTADLNDNFQLRTLFNYSESDSRYYIVGPNQALLNATGAAASPNDAVNFYDPAATPNLDLIRAIANSEIAGQGLDSLFNVRFILDGSLFQLPGGDVRVAIGAEHLQDEFKQRVAPPNAERGAVFDQAFTQYDREVNSVFGELQVPIIGEGNRMPGIHELTLSGSVRYDDFSDFGDTSNHKLGFSYDPVEWLTFRGNFSTSFNAPSPVDQLGSLRNTMSFYPFNAFVRPNDAPTVNGTIGVQGSQPDLTPQTAETYSFGFEIEPPFLQGLFASVNYYDVAFQDLLGVPTPNAGIFADFPDNVITNVNGLTNQQLIDFANRAPNGPSVIAPLLVGGCALPPGACPNPNTNTGVYEAVMFLTGNYGELNVQGLDFAVNYYRPTSFGSFDVGLSGNYTLDRTSKRGPGAAEVDLLDNNTSRLQLQASLGVDIGDVRAQATLNHSAGYDVVRNAVSLPQDHVGDFNTINLFFRYDASSLASMPEDLRFTLNINNVLDTDPPTYRGSTGQDNGYANGFTLGRLVMLGVSTKF